MQSRQNEDYADGTVHADHTDSTNSSGDQREDATSSSVSDAITDHLPPVFHVDTHPPSVLYPANTRRQSILSQLSGHLGRRSSSRFNRLSRELDTENDTELAVAISLPPPVYLESSSSAPRPPENHRNSVAFSTFSLTSRPSNVSMPPSYKAHASPEREQERQQEWEAAARLRRYYEEQRRMDSGAGWLHSLLWRDESSEQVPGRDMLGLCVLEQFRGFYRALWVLVLVIVGAISVFVPDLPPAAYACWIPLIVYIIIAIGVQAHQRHKEHEICELEYIVSQARQRRIRELMAQVELPSNHYFVTQYQKGHAHPVRTLLPPPPAYPQQPPMIAEQGVSENDTTSDTEDIHRTHAEALVDEEMTQHTPPPHVRIT